MRGAYTWSSTSVKDNVGLSAGAYTWGGGLIGGEMRYTLFLMQIFARS